MHVRKYIIVDDNVEFAENVAEILEDAGAEAAIAASGEQAVAMCEKTRFDAMVCDMRMPHMGGAEVLRRIRALDPGLPAIIMTAFTADDDLAAARREGLLAVLPKPVPIAELLQLLSDATRVS